MAATSRSVIACFVYVLAGLSLLVPSSGLTANEQQEAVPIKVLNAWDGVGRFWIDEAAIYADSSRKPAIDRPIMGQEGKGCPCERPWGKWYEYRYMAMGDVGVEGLYVFDEQVVEGKNYAKIKFCNDWAWIALPEDGRMSELEAEEKECYIRRQREKNVADRVPAQVLTVEMEKLLTISEEFSVMDGEWIKIIKLDKAGILTVSLPEGFEWEEFNYVTLRIVSTLTGDDFPSWGSSDLEDNQPFTVPLLAGRYKIILGELNEHWYLAPCPPNGQSINVMLTPLPAHIELDRAGSTPETAYDLGELTAPVVVSDDEHTARKSIKHSINLYNTVRPHSSLAMRVPDEVHNGDYDRHGRKLRKHSSTKSASEILQDLFDNHSLLGQLRGTAV